MFDTHAFAPGDVFTRAPAYILASLPSGEGTMGKHRGATHDDMLALWHQAVFEAHRAHVINAPARMGLVFMNDKSQRLYGNIENYGH